MTQTRYPVAKSSEFTDLEPVFLSVGGLKVAVYRFNGSYYAYSSWCPHQGGPACEGIVVGHVEAETGMGGSVSQRTSTQDVSIACPWHGVEFDLETGLCRADPKMRIAAFEVETEGDQVFVVGR